MTKKPKKARHDRDPHRLPAVIATPPAQAPIATYETAAALAEAGDYAKAHEIYVALEPNGTNDSLKALIRNDLGALAAVSGDWDEALSLFREALALDSACEPARANLRLLEADQRAVTQPEAARPASSKPAADRAIKVAILSFLFNWPSTGGGIVHTVELAQFLAAAGYDVRHIYARYDPWEIGRVDVPVSFPSIALHFKEAAWEAGAIQNRYRQAVNDFDPDYVLITDSWNIKPLLAEAVSGYPYILRLQAMECLCPLNNVRLLPQPDGQAGQCPLHQLATPVECGRCVRERGRLSGSLHQAERALSGVGLPGYAERLLRVFREAEAVLVVNPLTEAMVSPYCRTTRVVTAGMDPARFPLQAEPPSAKRPLVTLLFAGLVDEWMKGFRVLHEACALLWQRRQDFELVATADPPGSVDAFTRFVGWQSQATLPRQLADADVLVVPTVAQEALGRTAVEAMAAGRPVVASHLGGLPFTVADGATGLLFEPSNPRDLARKLELLLDNPALRAQLGRAGRQRFEEHYAWPVIIEKHYRSLLSQRRRP